MLTQIRTTRQEEHIPVHRRLQMILTTTHKALIKSNKLVRISSLRFPIKLHQVIMTHHHRKRQLSSLIGQSFLFVDFQKTTCFNQPTQQQGRSPTTQQPRPSTAPTRSSNPASPESPPPSYTSFRQESASSQRANIPSAVPSSSSSNNGHRSNESRDKSQQRHEDCDCSDDEMNEISEKRQNIFEGNPGPSGVQQMTNTVNSSSSDSSSFEDVGASNVKLNDEHWQVIEKTASNGIHTVEQPVDQMSIDENVVIPSPNQTEENSNEMTRSTIFEPVTNPEIRRVTRRRSDSSLLRKSNSITIDHSSFDPTQSGSEVKKLKISCNKCGKAKSNIKREILKLSEQLKSSNKSEVEVNSKIKEFLDYLESKSQPSEMTETENSQQQSNQNDENLEGARFIPSSTSHDEIEENIFDENEGINVYPVEEEERQPHSSTSTPRRFIQLDDIHSR